MSDRERDGTQAVEDDEAGTLESEDDEAAPDEVENTDRATDAIREKPVVVVVEPETPGNVGTIARAMKNFGLSDLKLVDPPELSEDGEAYGFAGHAREDVLPNAEEVTFEEVVENYHTVGTTAITGEDDRRHERWPFKTPTELKESLQTVDAPTAIVFGREGRGLNNDELGRLDEVCSIPAADDYPVLNLGQAATVLLYELRDLTVDETQLPDTAVTRAPEADIERFHDLFGDFLDAAGQQSHRQEKNALLMRRLLGRAHPTEREVHSLLGTVRKANTKLEHADYLAAKYDEHPYPRE
ncbi:TrmH family RNA methyltransferase [Halorubrum alkaliphilum]|uniref:TrmH family RNA methyltransferase n=1 Tax=Halorubrum alkaliphilum TaxID=261290 RepID=A0A8T4GEG8_9EURY|nr:TrmJ/YjtD family RNA methyltransferase [Halorubrum alkaliphilum]MBP1922137.1 TrmH family RNA methyltransferase [Halorubrum alkaliphilum]